MAPRLEETSLLSTTSTKHFDIRSSSSGDDDAVVGCHKSMLCVIATCIAVAAIAGLATVSLHSTPSILVPTGPYQLVECQEGSKFFDFYDFYNGADSLGSAGYNTYVSKQRAEQLGIMNVTTDENGDEYIYMKSTPTDKGPRESIRLEGKKRYNRGLFLLDLDHMPAGPGVWPAWWLTDEDSWPDHGEIDIVEGINNQTNAKTALHTSSMCSMYAQVPTWAKTGTWDRASGIPDTYTGLPNYNTSKEADDCWNMAAHQWFNQGCVTIDDANDSIGKPFNENGGGVYALEWDPINRYIKSWAFSRKHVPANLEDSMRTASDSNDKNHVVPDPSDWGLPYAYFAIGESTGCSADHFQNMHIVFNLAFCGNVAGNRFFMDCQEQTKQFNVSNDPIMSCNAFIQSEPDVLDEAYWKIRGAYVYERSMERPARKADAEPISSDEDEGES